MPAYWCVTVSLALRSKTPKIALTSTLLCANIARWSRFDFFFLVGVFASVFGDPTSVYKERLISNTASDPAGALFFSYYSYSVKCIL